MKITFLTMALDAMPFITRHIEQFEKLKLDWEWRIAEGVASPSHCTKWCAPMVPRLSLDGTTGYLEALTNWDPRVKLWQREQWNGKLHMLNTMCLSIREPGLVWEIDAFLVAEAFRHVFADAGILADTPTAWAWISFSCRDGGHLHDGTPIGEVVRLAETVALPRDLSIAS